MRNTKPDRRKLVVTENFYAELSTVLVYGETVFGKEASDRFFNEIMARIERLPFFPDANPVNRFVKSTETKTYRYIVYSSYYIVYSVSKTTIRVASIVHQSSSPKKLKKIK